MFSLLLRVCVYPINQSNHYNTLVTASVTHPFFFLHILCFSVAMAAAPRREPLTLNVTVSFGHNDAHTIEVPINITVHEVSSTSCDH
jgi:hypothetical protein